MQTKSPLTSIAFGSLIVAGAFTSMGIAHAAILTDVDGTADFGWAVGLTDGSLVVGAPGDIQPGAAYYYVDGTVLTLKKQDAGSVAGSSYFGYAASASGSRALVGDFGDKAGTPSIQVGAAYYYKDLGASAGGGNEVVTETLKLQASDGARNAYFGRSVSLSNDNALVGAFGDKYDATNRYVGAAYYFKNLDNATDEAGGVVTETLKLASDRAAGQSSYFGLSLSLSGNNALVSALGVGANRGEVYYYRDLANVAPVAGETVKETFVLSASDGQAGDMFGRIVALVGDSAIVGANGSANNRGAAYYYSDLNRAEANTVVEETVRLLASDGKAGDEFGFHASLSEGNALVGARLRGSQMGAAYFFKGLDQAAAGSTVTENIMLTASDGKAGDVFGSSVSLNGTSFLIGANRAGDSRAGQVYTGDIRTFSVLDDGNTHLSTGGLSFVSKDDWVIGSTSSGNSVTVSRDPVTNIGDVANVTNIGKHVYIGRQAGANGNELRIEGTLLANQIHVGAAGNTGNVLFASSGASVDATSIHLALNNSIGLYGLLLDYGDLINWLDLQGGIRLFANANGVTLDNAAEFLRISERDGYTLYTAVPEPSTYAVVLGAVVIGFAITCRRRNAHKS